MRISTTIVTGVAAIAVAATPEKANPAFIGKIKPPLLN